MELVRIVGRRRRDRRRPTTPTGLRASSVAATRVVLRWRPARDDRGVARYEVLRDGKRLVSTRGTTWTDRAVAADRRYEYRVRAIDAAGNRSLATKPIAVRTLAVVAGAGTPSLPAGPVAGPDLGPGATTGGVPGDASPPPAPPPPVLTAAMVDRLYWRAGFGPTPAERAQWTGKPVADLVDFFLESPQSLSTTVPPPLTQTNQPIDPLVSREELVMEWLDTMQRAQNPFIERLAFFWHRLWAITTADGIPSKFMLTYRDRLRRFADLPADPDLSFRDLSREMTTTDGAMSLFLNGTQNTRNRPNENYGREFMELFCLGVRDAQGNANYTEADIRDLARAFTGWRVDQTPESPTYGTVTFVLSRHDTGQKTIFGQTANWGADPAQGSGTQDAIDLVLAHPAHAPYLVRRLWAEFIVTPIPDATLSDLVAAYTANSAFKLKPLLRKILLDPLIFESLDEPNMVKPPIVYLVGAQRALNAPMKWFWQREALQNMQQVPYEPPNVAGWEGGLAWLNTNTVAARHDTINRLLRLAHHPSPAPDSSTGYPGSVPIADPGAGETGQQAFDLAYAACGSPWLSAGTRDSLVAFAGTHLATTATNRLQRQYALRALILGGPDGQVM